VSKGDPAELYKPDGERDYMRYAEALDIGDDEMAGGPIEVRPGLVVRPATLEDLRLLYRLDSLVYADMNLALNHRPVASHPLGEPDRFEAAFVFTRPIQEVRDVLHLGREHFRATALRAFGGVSEPVFREVIVAIGRQINVHAAIVTARALVWRRKNHPLRHWLRTLGSGRRR
jgi:hypothetical protein